jgi:predicted carbohydrate-binding protein with CBM5 and CBM33 domain
MPIRRLGAVLAATVLVALSTATPASAHGAPTRPISRTAACAGEGTETGTAACKAAAKANGQPFGSFDNLRIGGVNGRDREVVPDGKLCSGGLAAYRGLDLARDDWPATKARAGETISVRYASPIPHKGTFRIYLTKEGYDPAEPLRWDDLADRAVLVDKDPPLVDGSYRMTAKLPKDRSGRHVLYTIWQTSSTPDTYYSCSDLVIEGKHGAAPKPAAKAVVVPPKASKAAKKPEPAPTASQGPAPAAGTPSPQQLRRAAGEAPDDKSMLYLAIGLLVVAAVLGTYAVARIRRGRRVQDLPRQRGFR